MTGIVTRRATSVNDSGGSDEAGEELVREEAAAEGQRVAVAGGLEKPGREGPRQDRLDGRA